MCQRLRVYCDAQVHAGMYKALTFNSQYSKKEKMHAKEMIQGTHPSLQRVISIAAETPARSAAP